MGLSVVEACAAAFDRVGMPEGRFHLSQATIAMATAAKSNSTMALDAIETVRLEARGDVPLHLRDSHRDGETLGHGADIFILTLMRGIGSPKIIYRAPFEVRSSINPLIKVKRHSLVQGLERSEKLNLRMISGGAGDPLLNDSSERVSVSLMRDE